MYPPEDEGVKPENAWQIDGLNDDQQKMVNGIIRAMIPDDQISLEERFNQLSSEKQKMIQNLVK